MSMDNERFEALAKEFHADTGYLAPGKDSREPIAEAQEVHIAELWKAWCKGRVRGLEAVRP